MKKYFMYALVLLIAFGGISKVNAKDCSYYRKAVLGPAENISVDVTIDANGNAKSVIKNYYKDYNMNNNEDIQNWGDIKSHYMETNKCPQYILVTKGWTGYNVYLAYNEQALQDIAANKGFQVGSDEAIITHNSNEYTAPAVNENFYKDAEDKTKAIRSAVDNYKLEDCKDPSKVITRVSECDDQLKAMKMFASSTESEFRGLIASGDVDGNDPRIKALFEAIEYAKGIQAEIEKELEEEHRQIDSEMKGGKKAKPAPNTSLDSDECPIDPNSETYKDLIGALNIMKIAGPLLVIGFTIFEFIKATASGDSQNELKKLSGRLVKRMIFCVLLFAVPILVEVVLKVADVIPENGCSFTQADIDNGKK